MVILSDTKLICLALWYDSYPFELFHFLLMVATARCISSSLYYRIVL